MTIWFSADLHLGHENIIKYCNRPFKNSKEMDRNLINNFQEKLKPKDVLYFLGDLSFKSELAEIFFENLNDIEIHFIIGNHDSKEVVNIAKKYCKSIDHLNDIVIDGQAMTLCHYAMRVWNKSHYNAWQLYGHSHGRLSPIGKQFDVGIDNNKYSPIPYNELIIIMDEKPNNFNYILKDKKSDLA